MYTLRISSVILRHISFKVVSLSNVAKPSTRARITNKQIKKNQG